MNHTEKDKYFDHESFRILIDNIGLQQKAQRHHKINNDRAVYSELREYIRFQLETYSIQACGKDAGNTPTDIDKLIITPLTQEIIQLASRECTQRAQLLNMVFNFYQQSLVLMDSNCKQKVNSVYAVQTNKIESQKVQYESRIRELTQQLSSLKKENQQKWKNFYLIVKDNRVLRRQKGKLQHCIHEEIIKVQNMNQEMILLAKENEKNKLLLNYSNEQGSLDLYINNNNSIMQLQDFMKSYPKYAKKNMRIALDQLQIQENQNLNEKIQNLIKAAREEGILDDYEDLVDVTRENKFIVNNYTQTEAFDIDFISNRHLMDSSHTHTHQQSSITKPQGENKSRHTQTIRKSLRVVNNVVNEILYARMRLDKSKTTNRRYALLTNLIDDVPLIETIRHFKDNIIFKTVSVRITAKESMSLRSGKLISNIINLAFDDYGELLLTKRSSMAYKDRGSNEGKMNLMKQKSKHSQEERVSRSFQKKNQEDIEFRNSKKQSMLANSRGMEENERRKSIFKRSITVTDNNLILKDKDDDNMLINIHSTQRIEEEHQSETNLLDLNRLTKKSARSINHTSIKNTSHLLRIAQNQHVQENEAIVLEKSSSTNNIFSSFDTNIDQHQQKVMHQHQSSQKNNQKELQTKVMKKEGNKSQILSRKSMNTRFSINSKAQTSKSKQRSSQMDIKQLQHMKENKIMSNSQQNLDNRGHNMQRHNDNMSHHPSHQINETIAQEANQGSFHNINTLQQAVTQADYIVQPRYSQNNKVNHQKRQYIISKRVNTLPVDSSTNHKSNFTMSKDETHKLSYNFNDQDFKVGQPHIRSQINGNKVESTSKVRLKEKTKMVNMLSVEGLKFCEKVYKSLFNRKKQMLQKKMVLEQFMRSFTKMNYGQHVELCLSNSYSSLHKDQQTSQLLQLFNILVNRNESISYLQYLFKLFIRLVMINNNQCLFIETSRQYKIHKEFAYIHFSSSKAEQIVRAFENRIMARPYINVCQIFINMEVNLHRQLLQCQLYTFLQKLLPKSQSSIAIVQVQQIYQLFMFEKSYSKLKSHLVGYKKKEIDVLALCFYAVKEEMSGLLVISDFIKQEYARSQDDECIDWQQIQSMAKMTDKCSWSFGLINEYQLWYSFQDKMLLYKYLKLILSNNIKPKSSSQFISTRTQISAQNTQNYFLF